MMEAMSFSFTSLRFDLKGFVAWPRESPLSSSSIQTLMDDPRPLMLPVPMGHLFREADAVAMVATAVVMAVGAVAMVVEDMEGAVGVVDMVVVVVTAVAVAMAVVATVVAVVAMAVHAEAEEVVAVGLVIPVVRRVTWLGTAARVAEAVEVGTAVEAAAVAVGAATAVESLGISPGIAQPVLVEVIV